MTTPWSQRFEQGLHPAIHRFNASIGFDIALIEFDLTGSVAQAKMLAHTGIIADTEAQMLVQGLEQIRTEWQEGQFQPGIEAEDIHYAIEQRLVEIVGDVGKKLHTGRSRNDQVGTDLRLWLRSEIDSVVEMLRGFQRILLDLAKENVETLIPGYTHLQRAQPISLAHHLLAYVEMTERDQERLTQLRTRVNISPLGSGALAGTVLPIDRHFSAELLGFAAVSENSLDSVSDRDYAIEFLSAASLILVHLSRLSEEVILWASQEFRFVTLTDRCATGSSLMPQKKNPDVPELVRGKSGRVFGHLVGLLTVMKGLPLAYNKDLQEDKEGLFDTVSTVKQCLEAMTILLREGIVFNPERLSSAVNEDYSNATDAADYLVRKGIPFREAYGVIGGIVKHGIKTGHLLKEISIEDWRTFHPAFEADLYAAIEPATIVAARNSYGGTGFVQVRAALARAETRWQNSAK
jgi:argininosuccinate lyase